jgi:hypothetical protein
MSKNTRHVIHHQGSPRGDSDGVLIVAAVVVIGGAIIAISALIGAILSILPYLLGAGVISAGTFVFVNSQFAKLKFKMLQFKGIQKDIFKAREAEKRSEEVAASLKSSERTIARQAAEDITNSHIERFEKKKSEITTIIEAGLGRLSESRLKAIKKAKNAKTPEKFQKGLEKLDEAIHKLETLLMELNDTKP